MLFIDWQISIFSRVILFIGVYTRTQIEVKVKFGEGALNPVSD